MQPCSCQGAKVGGVPTSSQSVPLRMPPRLMPGTGWDPVLLAEGLDLPVQHWPGVHRKLQTQLLPEAPLNSTMSGQNSANISQMHEGVPYTQEKPARLRPSGLIKHVVTA